MARGKRSSGDGDEDTRKTEMIVLRVTKKEKKQLADEARGKCTVSELVHSKVFRGGLRSHDALRQVAALHDVGMSLRDLARKDDVPQLQLQALVALTRQSILALTRDLP